MNSAQEQRSPSPEGSFAEASARLRAAHPALEAVEIFITDLNGVQRGKRLDIAALPKLGEGAARLPVSSLAIDVFGADIAGAGLAIEIGDPDGALIPDPKTLAPMAWSHPPAAHVIGDLTDVDRTRPAEICARAALARQAALAAAEGMTPVMAFELEFYLIDAERDPRGRPQPPTPPGGAERLARQQIYELNVANRFDAILSEMLAAARTCGAPADIAICEFGAGQFEINLTHVADAVAAADHLIFLKRAIRGVARRHGYDATFMAKPYGESAGSGLHLHLSFVDGEGRNLLAADAGATEPSSKLRAAIGGLKATMPEIALALAPHANSYRRFQPGSHAPTVAAWGTDNRGVALRTPEISGPGARLEHRTAGADANPYLVAALVLAGARRGVAQGVDPGAPTFGEAGPSDGPSLPQSWEAAVSAWEASDFARDALGAPLHRVFGKLKRQEIATMAARVSDVEFDAYLRVV